MLLPLQSNDPSCWLHSLSNASEVKPRLERVEIIKDVRQQEVEQRPQLRQVVLQWSSSQQQPVCSFVLFQFPNKTRSLTLQDKRQAYTTYRMRRQLRFLIRCPSSTTRYFHANFSKYLRSFMTISYEVMTTGYDWVPASRGILCETRSSSLRSLRSALDPWYNTVGI